MEWGVGRPCTDTVIGSCSSGSAGPRPAPPHRVLGVALGPAAQVSVYHGPAGRAVWRDAVGQGLH